MKKTKGSNFHTSESIFNNQFKEIYNNLFKLYLNNKVQKNIWIWKEQDEPHNYNIHFFANFNNLKSVTLYKNDEVIYTTSFIDDNQEHIFNYIHSDTSENIIPSDKFKIIVETYDEYVLVKGFPENDGKENNEFDHDYSIDDFGEFINFPRKNYVLSLDYPNTEPPYNDKLTEDDYHYMNRILFYLQHLQDVPLAVLEIWKLFGIPIDEILMVNREAILCKMFETSRHHGNWIPEKWEHKDLLCQNENESLFFTASVDDLTPIALQDFTFVFEIINHLGKKVDRLFYIVPYINGERTEFVLQSDQSWRVSSSLFDGTVATFSFKCFNSIDDIDNEEFGLESNEITINIRSCNDADWYVNTEGNDQNDGLTIETAFKTLEKAISVVEGSKNIIVLGDGTYELNDTSTISKNTKIITCPNTTATITCPNTTFFKVSQDCQLYLQNIYFNYSSFKQWIDDCLFTNKNIDSNFLNIGVDVLEIITDSENPEFMMEDEWIDTCLVNSHDWEVEITDGESDATFVIDDDGENPNLIVGEEE
ncbi:MAG: hypothetical protein Q4P18_07290 [Methanobrevibacter sp.]|nr:hypothetical protein [Methanobrevibacter sp.]